MSTLYELKKALQEVSDRFSNVWLSSWIPIKVDGKEIESVTFNERTNIVEIKTKEE